MGLALAFGAGLALALRGMPFPPTPLLLVLLLAPIRRFLRPARGANDPGSFRSRGGGGSGAAAPRPAPPLSLALPALLAAAAGLSLGHVWLARQAGDCRHQIGEGPVEAVRGRFLGRPGGGGVGFRVEGGLPGGCRGEVRAYGSGSPEARGRRKAGPGGDAVVPGAPMVIAGRWRRSPAADASRPDRVGYLLVDRVSPGAGPGSVRGWHLHLRGAAQERIRWLFPRRRAVVEALILARKESLDPSVREAFARSGTAHLLAISGFHVGVLAGLLLALARVLGLGPRRSPLLAAAGAWAYVLWIGVPDAAARAALLLTFLAAGRSRGAPVVPLGALATAFVALLLLDPGGLRRPGFQLSFAGVAGLLLWARPLERRLSGPGAGPVRRAVAPALAAAVAATVATVPLVAWHFGRVPVVGIPATLIVTPLVSLAIPGVLGALALSGLEPGAARFLAGGVELLLDGAVSVAGAAAALPWAAPWIPRSWIPAGALGIAAGAALVGYLPGVTGWRRRVVLAAGAAAALLAAPAAEAVARRGALEIAFLDVGQGDAVAIRSPAGRWILVDAGPRSASFDAGARRVVPWLKRRGVRRLEALLLTHPDLDHLGGAPAVLAEFEVGGVLDPGVANPKLPFGEALAAARDRGVGWWRARRGRTLSLDGVELRVLHAGPPPPAASLSLEGSESNALSVVLHLRFGRFRALLTGDAPAAVEAGVLGGLDGPVDLLKVAHHGSATSTPVELLEGARPELAVIPVGHRNRYGHPDSRVLGRLRAAGARILRTDLHGTVTVRASRDGSWSTESEREGAGR